ncbi:mechanosensitive ion channel protein MscS [Longibacter salinarum]|uniref:Mechanosensitive ion channel protein MscS n=1 Tax=Longibacter salinarum TaxID=1850348 RepID=A0A2A8D0C4_9BACT|nr:mechanosensitive ion channel family protein [Longibacter salinarum]PEN14311.1 mechanosensitive ion channel protein MscS [Longibacter salinarum]
MKSFFSGIIERLRSDLNPQTLADGTADLLANVVVGGLVFVVFYVLWRLINVALQRGLNRSTIDKTTASFIQTIVKYVLLGIGLIQALASIGIDATAFLASLGIVGLTIGFAARDALSNLISGLLIFWDRPFVINDLVEVEGSYGRVDTITLRSTRVVTTDGRMLAIPNTTIVNSVVASYTNFPHVRLDISVTIDVEEDLNRTEQILLDLVMEDPDYLSEPMPRVVVTALNDYNVELQLQAWYRNEYNHLAEQFDLRKRVFEALTTAGVAMPYETIEVRTGPSHPFQIAGQTKEG